MMIFMAIGIDQEM